MNKVDVDYEVFFNSIIRSAKQAQA